MIDYIGDISRNDAALLERLATSATRILEFGVGASTQVMATSGAGMLHTLDTSMEWIKRTEQNLQKFKPFHRLVTFGWYPSFEYTPPEYDLIFVDGVDRERFNFAFNAWQILAYGGVMAFHDTRRLTPYKDETTTDIQKALAIVQRFSPEVRDVELNKDYSNITVIKKRYDGPLLEEDWNFKEGRTPAQRGYR